MSIKYIFNPFTGNFDAINTGGGSDTPWTVDHNANGHNLYDSTGDLKLDQNVGTPGLNGRGYSMKAQDVTSTAADATGGQFVLKAGDSHNFSGSGLSKGAKITLYGGGYQGAGYMLFETGAGYSSVFHGFNFNNNFTIDHQGTLSNPNGDLNIDQGSGAGNNHNIVIKGGTNTTAYGAGGSLTLSGGYSNNGEGYTFTPASIFMAGGSSYGGDFILTPAAGNNGSGSFIFVNSNIFSIGGNTGNVTSGHNVLDNGGQTLINTKTPVQVVIGTYTVGSTSPSGTTGTTITRHQTDTPSSSYYNTSLYPVDIGAITGVDGFGANFTDDGSGHLIVAAQDKTDSPTSLNFSTSQSPVIPGTIIGYDAYNVSISENSSTGEISSDFQTTGSTEYPSTLDFNTSQYPVAPSSIGGTDYYGATISDDGSGNIGVSTAQSTSYYPSSADFDLPNTPIIPGSIGGNDSFGGSVTDDGVGNLNTTQTTNSPTEYPYSSSYTLSHGNITPGTVSGTDNFGNYFYDDGSGNLVDSNTYYGVGESPSTYSFNTYYYPIATYSISGSADNGANIYDDGAGNVYEDIGSTVIGTIDYATGAYTDVSGGTIQVLGIGYHYTFPNPIAYIDYTTGAVTDNSGGFISTTAIGYTFSISNPIAYIDYSTGHVSDNTGGVDPITYIGYSYGYVGTIATIDYSTGAVTHSISDQISSITYYYGYTGVIGTINYSTGFFSSSQNDQISSISYHYGINGIMATIDYSTGAVTDATSGVDYTQSITYNSTITPGVFNNQDVGYTIWSYRDISGSRFYDSSAGTSTTVSDYSGSNFYVDLTWSTGTDATGYVIQNTTNGYYKDVGDVLTANDFGDGVGWTSGTFSPDHISPYAVTTDSTDKAQVNGAMTILTSFTLVPSPTPTNPREGMAYVDNSSSPSHFKMYLNGAWNTII